MKGILKVKNKMNFDEKQNRRDRWERKKKTSFKKNKFKRPKQKEFNQHKEYLDSHQ